MLASFESKTLNLFCPAFFIFEWCVSNFLTSFMDSPLALARENQLIKRQCLAGRSNVGLRSSLSVGKIS
jgi:hypothetical protein